MHSTGRGRAAMKFGVMRGPAGRSLCLVTPEIWRKGRFAPFFERPESASMASLRLVSGGEHRLGNGNGIHRHRLGAAKGMMTKS